MAKKEKFTASGFDYGAAGTEAKPEKKADCYRFNAKLPLEHKAFLQEMAWRNRLSINDFMVKIIDEYMEAHPEWKETIDILNK